jgi:hypothetical protein
MKYESTAILASLKKVVDHPTAFLFRTADCPLYDDAAISPNPNSTSASK